MPEDLSASSRVYALHKYVPVLMGTLYLGGLALRPGPLPELLVAWVLLLLALHLHSSQFRRLALLDHCLVVSDRKRSIHVPLGNVLRVTQNGIRRGVIALREPSEFGRRIVFIASSSAGETLQRLLAERPAAECTHAQSPVDAPKLGELGAPPDSPR